jgi:hypothetical protein
MILKQNDSEMHPALCAYRWGYSKALKRFTLPLSTQIVTV